MEPTGVLSTLGVAGAAALFLSVSLAGLTRWYPSPVLGYWSVGWLAAAVASVASVFALVSLASPSGVGRSVSIGVFVAAMGVHAFFQVEGVRRLDRPALPRGVLAAGALALLAYAVLAVALTTDGAPAVQTFFRLGVPYAVLGASCIASGVLISISRAAGAAGLGVRLLPVALVVYGVQSLLSAGVATGWVGLSTLPALLLNLLALLLVAFAIPLWFLEEERAAMKEAQEREHTVRERLINGQRLEALGQLAAGIAHDFNNLLTVVGAHAELIHMEDVPPGVHDSVDEINEAQQRGTRLVNHLLTFARRVPVAKKRMDLRHEVDRLEGLLRPLIGDRIDLTIEHHGVEAPVLMGAEEAERMIMNLMLNARDAVGDRGRVTVRTAVLDAADPWEVGGTAVPPGRWCTLVVEDDGEGIPDAIRARIFDPFFTTKVRNRGTGLGLATVHGVVHEVGGHIAVESEEGQGARFTIFLPYRD